MSGIQLETIFKTAAVFTGLLALTLQFCGYFQFRRVRGMLVRENLEARNLKTCRSEFFSRPRDEDFMAFLFTIACAYFGWVVLYKPYGFLPVLTVVLLTACLSGYGAFQRLQNSFRKLAFLNDSHRRILQKGQLLFCFGIPMLVAAELCLIVVLVFSPEQLDQLVWLRQISK